MLSIYTQENDRILSSAINTEGEVLPACQLGAVWYDLYNPTRNEDNYVEQCLSLSIPTRAEMDEIEPSARLYNEEDAEFMTVTALSELDSEEPVKTPITFVLKGGSLVTVRYAEPLPFTTFAHRIQKPGGPACTSGEMAMLGILEAMINRMADILERVGGDVDRFSHKVFRSRVRNATQKTLNLNAVIEQIGRKGDMLSMVRESLVSFTRLLSYHQAIAKGTTKAGKDVRQKMKILQRDVGSLTDHAAFLTNKINFLLDATLGLINLEQNQIIKIFSVAAVVFLPPTLVASIYGMNFDYMPELKWVLGYPWAFALMVLSAILPYLYFKRRGWL
ncbi:magnesium transporter CorA family protein [Phyllobacterium zundukense]|uniref:Magnesium transport protein CorA n=1 Tax=Phyllobacterium zundukense TaxID=1867719 RepID=A0A2N9W2T9_9HYPH|nr:magnesium transporter CorA family protein [Phyllobacterium zundukense]ATU94613.1 magnesium transporter [Phyllobacterium zundukense]PIO46057.1 magnesium transporter [Phyllobacterium zundukense]